MGGPRRQQTRELLLGQASFSPPVVRPKSWGGNFRRLTLHGSISPLEPGEGLGKAWGVTTAVANAIARMTKRQKLALADQLLAETGAKSSSVRVKHTPKSGRSQFVRSKITGQIVTRGAQGAPRVTSEQVRALLN